MQNGLMYKFALSVSFLAFAPAMMTYTPKAHADTIKNTGACTSHEKMVKLLEGKFSQKQVAIATASYLMVEVFVSKKGQFDVVATDKNMLSCILLEGQSWEYSPTQGENT